MCDFDATVASQIGIDIEILVLSSVMALSWQAKPGCPTHLRDVIEHFVNDRDAVWRLPPAPKGEVFDSFEQCQERLNVFTMIEGFVITIRGHGDPRNSCRRFQCIHHDEETRNHRELEHRTEKDSVEKIISNRQRDATHTKQKGCIWYVFCSFKDIGKCGSDVKGFYLVAPKLSVELC